jgi:hypothetical protein
MTADIEIWGAVRAGDARPSSMRRTCSAFSILHSPEPAFVLPVITAGNTTIPGVSQMAEEAQIKRIRLRRVFRKDTR